ncbi:hypothetical protein M8J77_021633 [Diaphorina citri]|nr:hypothetical protein M8J77_021633 [Diaphorina citri]
MFPTPRYVYPLICLGITAYWSSYIYDHMRSTYRRPVVIRDKNGQIIAQFTPTVPKSTFRRHNPTSVADWSRAQAFGPEMLKDCAVPRTEFLVQSIAESYQTTHMIVSYTNNCSKNNNNNNNDEYDNNHNNHNNNMTKEKS